MIDVSKRYELAASLDFEGIETASAVAHTGTIFLNFAVHDANKVSAKRSLADTIDRVARMPVREAE